jgi:enamine deaminase RidA (YjgF/YER057c/UK114 family)
VPTSTAVVETDAAGRYAKQLLAHLGRKNPVDPLAGTADGGRIRFAYGTGTVRPEDGRLVLRAAAADEESLARVEDVLSRHLERFGARRELSVHWSTGEGRVRTIHTDDAPAHAGPVPQAVEAGGWIHVSALFGVHPGDRTIPEDARAEAGQLFDNLAAILTAGGADLGDVVRVGIVMRDLQRDRPVFNEVWAERFGEHRPARSAFESSAFGRPGENARFMIEVAAYRG